MLAIFLPILVPLATAVVLLLLRGRLQTQRIVAALSTLAVFGVSIAILLIVRRDGIQVCHQGDWGAGAGDWAIPIGITLVADLFSCIMVCIAMTLAVAVLFYSFRSIDKERQRFYFYPLFMFQLMGINGCFLTGDIFNLFVFFEVMLIASYALISLGGERRQMEATVKYMVMNLLASTLLVGTVALLYGQLGTLNMADLAQRITEAPDQGMITPIAILLIAVFGVKAALFGLWFWMPGTYSVIPAAVAAFFGGIMAEVGVYCIFRVCTLMFVNDSGGTPTMFSPLGTIILVAAGLTMFIGVLGAAAQTNFRGILTYHISSQVGYLILGLGIFTVASVAGAIFYTIHYTLCKSSLFLCAGVAERITGRKDIREMGGLVSHPFTALLFMIGILSLAGLPPLSGFWAKFLLVKAGFEEAFANNDVLIYVMVGVALVTSLLTLYSMTKIWQKAYWGEPKHKRVPGVSYKTMVPSIAFLVIIGVVIGLGAEPFMDLCTEAADQLMDRQQYMTAVLGGG